MPAHSNEVDELKAQARRMEVGESRVGATWCIGCRDIQARWPTAYSAGISPPRQGWPRRAAVAQQLIRISSRSRQRRSERRRTGDATRAAIATERRHRPWQRAIGSGAPAAAIARRHVRGTGHKRLCHAEEGGREDKNSDQAAKHGLNKTLRPIQPKSRLV